MTGLNHRLGSGLAVGALALAGALGTANFARAEAVVGSSISTSLAATWVSDYYFRGEPVENQGFIFQPEAEVTFNDVLSFEVMDGESISISPYLGTWMSIHDPSSPSAGGNSLFEIDYYFGIDIGLPYGFGFDINYTFYTYPNDATEEELILTLYYDATDLIAGLGVDGLSAEVYYSLAIGTQGSATIYNEIGFSLDYEMDVMEDMPITLGLDFALGLSYRGYYTAEFDAGQHQNFGFAAVTLRAGMPLSFIPEEFGEWSIEAGVMFNFINSNIGDAAIAPSEDFKAIGYLTVGVDF
ncbi:MAG: hypothetical protein JJU36_10270 [Phycisphaeraceae bacterium]|nr:hypothetical protein [Phycisphaeraceae bacterium]